MIPPDRTFATHFPVTAEPLAPEQGQFHGAEVMPASVETALPTGNTDDSTPMDWSATPCDITSCRHELTSLEFRNQFVALINEGELDKALELANNTDLKGGKDAPILNAINVISDQTGRYRLLEPIVKLGLSFEPFFPTKFLNAILSFPFDIWRPCYQQLISKAHPSERMKLMADYSEQCLIHISANAHLKSRFILEQGMMITERYNNTDTSVLEAHKMKIRSLEDQPETALEHSQYLDKESAKDFELENLLRAKAFDGIMPLIDRSGAMKVHLAVITLQYLCCHPRDEPTALILEIIKAVLQLDHPDLLTISKALLSLECSVWEHCIILITNKLPEEFRRDFRSDLAEFYKDHDEKKSWLLATR